MACVPLFAIAFNNIKDEFYHSTATSEAPFAELQSNLISSLSQPLSAWCFDEIDQLQINTDCSGDGRSDLIPVTAYQIRSCVAELFSVQMEQRYILFEGRFSFTIEASEYTIPLRIANFNVRIPVPSGRIRSEVDTWDYFGIDTSNADRPDTSSRLTIVSAAQDMEFNNLADFFPGPAEREASFPISYTQELWLYQYALAANGTPVELEGAFFRMLYLSAVTITTLGYGDIVPVTGLARMLVAVEAVLGIVLIGLFMSAISTRIRPKE